MSRALISICLIGLLAPALQAGLLSVPEAYTPELSWPVVVSTQDNPSPELMKKTPYFLVHAGGKGMQATKKIRAELLAVAKRYNINPFRICGTGFSRGGQEILIQAWQYPARFAAIAPVCNDLREKPDRNNRHLNVKYLFNVPTLYLHGEGDSFRRTGEIGFKLAKAAGCPAWWRTYPGGHSPKMPFKENVKLLTDFFNKKRLNPYPKRVVHLIEHKRHSRAFWVDAILVKDAVGPKAVFDVTVKKDIRIEVKANEHIASLELMLKDKVIIKKSNHIEVKANEHIASLELMLNDKLVDMKKPVTVTAGEKTLYKGPTKAKLTLKLRKGETYERVPQTPLWQELQAIRAKAKPAAKAKK